MFDRHQPFGIRTGTIGLVMWGLLAAAAVGAERSAPQGEPKPASASGAQARALAATIDRLLTAKWAEGKIVPAPLADDAEFLRRVSLDLTGKIPTAAEARDFLDDRRTDKRERLVDRLLASPAYLVHATEIWRSLLLPEADTDAQARSLAPTFDAWLRRQVAENVPYDKIVRTILTMDLGGRARRVSTRLEVRAEPTPLAFYVAKEGKPENLAAGTARVFLGLRLECAQCHNHPFAHWKRDEFWGFASFFAGVGRSGPADGAGRVREISGRSELAIPGTDRVAAATFLDGKKPALTARSKTGPRTLLAAWITAPENPYFARAAVNRVWARFFGTGLVEPVDDMGEENPPVHPELLDELARDFRLHRYDLNYLIRALTSTRAYGLTSAVGRSEASPPYLFAAMPVRGLSPGQLFESLARATGYRQDFGPERRGIAFMDGERARFLELFARRDERPIEAQTSILQALALMNGTITASATSLETGDTLGAIAEAPYLDPAGRIESLYLAALTRRPRPEELALLVPFVERGGSTGHPGQALADVLWALLNSPEFTLNH